MVIEQPLYLLQYKFHTKLAENNYQLNQVQPIFLHSALFFGIDSKNTYNMHCESTYGSVQHHILKTNKANTQYCRHLRL